MEEDKRIYEFGEFRLDQDQRLLFHRERPVKVSPKDLDLLFYFVCNSNRVIEKDRLMEAVWPDSFVEESNLAVHISNLRRIFSQDGVDSARIETFPKRGYRFSASVRERVGEDPDSELGPGPRKNAISEGGSDFLPFEKEAQLADSLTKGNLTAHPERWIRGLLLAIGIFAVIAAVLGFYFYLKRPRVPFRNMTVQKLTSSGDVNYQILSPDGKYVVYSKGGDSYLKGKPSLWVRQIGANSEIQLLGNYKFFDHSATFAPDGQSIYVGTLSPDGKEMLLNEPILGGPPMVSAVPAAFVIPSPDGKRFVYFGNSITTGETSIKTINADGSDDRVLASRQAPNYFENIGPWSPDGRYIMCHGRKAGEGYSQLVALNVANGAETVINSRKWNGISGTSWLADSSGVIIAATDEYSIFPQIWFVAFPSGRTERISNDANIYLRASVSSDGTMMTAIQRDRPALIWSVPVATGTFNAENKDPQIDVSSAAIISSTKLEGFWGLSRAPDGRLVFTSDEAGNTDIWIMNQDGTGRRQLPTDRHNDTHPSVCGDGKYIVFQSNRTGTEHVWRMDLDGANQTQLTSGDVERAPSCSPDGQWIVYTSWATKKASLWKMSIDGQQQEQLTKTVSFRASISPDGSLIAYDFATPSGQKIGIMPASGGEPVRVFDVPSIIYEMQGAIKWAPDGRGLTIMGSENGVANLWLQPMDGELRKLTNFTSQGIWNYDFSSDGQRLFISRGIYSSDIVLFTETQ